MATVVYSASNQIFVVMRQRGRTLERPGYDRGQQANLGVAGAPSGAIGLPGNVGVWDRRDDHAHVFLFVRFNRQFLGATVWFAPGDGQFCAFWDVSVDGCQRQAATFVGGVAGEHRNTDDVAVSVGDLVVVGGTVVGQWQVEELVVRAFNIQWGTQDFFQVISVPLESDLAALFVLIDGFECVTPDEVVIEFHEGTVADFPWIDVIIFDVVRDERASQWCGGFIGVSAEPFAVTAFCFTRVDAWQWRWDPAGFQGVGCIGARTNWQQTELGACFDDGVTNASVVFVWSVDFQTWRTGHTVTQGANFQSVNVHVGHAEEFQLFNFGAVELVDDIPSSRALNLEAEQFTRYCRTIGTRWRTAVNLQVEVLVVTLFSVVHQPVGDWGATNVGEFVFGFAEQDTVTDDCTDRRHRYVLLGHIDLEVSNRVDRGIRDQVDGVRTGEEDLVHVVGLVVEDRSVAPCFLFVDPVTEVCWNDWVDVGTGLSVAQQFHCGLFVEQILKRLCHDGRLSNVVC